VPGNGVRWGHLSNGSNGPHGSNGLVGPVATDRGTGTPGATGRTGASLYVGHHRPGLQRVVQAGLWLAVGLGGLGGAVTLLGRSGGDAEAVVAGTNSQAADASAVPGPVTATAEMAVEEWLTSTDDDSGHLDQVFVEEVAVRPGGDGSRMDVTRVTAITGHLVEEGYWVVTVRADVVESVAGETQPPIPWYVEVGIVGDVGDGLAALSTPGVVPAPPTTFEGWASSRPTLSAPGDDDPVATTVQGFLGAILTGQGDPSPYLAPGAVIPAASPPPFAHVVISGMATQEQEGGELQVWVDVVATTPAGREQPVSYELVASPRADGWEIAALWGAPSLGSAPAPEGRGQG
jgi:hypothetical protein